MHLAPAKNARRHDQWPQDVHTPGTRWTKHVKNFKKFMISDVPRKYTLLWLTNDLHTTHLVNDPPSPATAPMMVTVSSLILVLQKLNHFAFPCMDSSPGRHSDGLRGHRHQANLVSTFLRLNLVASCFRNAVPSFLPFSHWFLLVLDFSLVSAIGVPARLTGDLSGVSEIPLCSQRSLDLYWWRRILLPLSLYDKCCVLTPI